MFALHGTVDCGVSREELPQGPIVILVLPLYLLYSSYTMHKINVFISNNHFFSFVIDEEPSLRVICKHIL